MDAGIVEQYLVTYGLIPAIIFTILFFLLKTSINSKFKIIQDREITNLKNTYEKELESIKHQLQLEHAKLSIVYDSQKISFQHVIIAMREAIEALVQTYDENWVPIERKYFNDFKKVMYQESLFIGKDGLRALNLFKDIFSSTIRDPEDESYRTSETDRRIRQAYRHLVYLFDQIVDYFQSQVGLSNEGNPLINAELLGVCGFLNHNVLSDVRSKLPEDLKVTSDENPQKTVVKYKNNIDGIKKVLQGIIDEIKAEEDDYSSWTLFEAEEYLESMSKIEQDLKRSSR